MLPLSLVRVNELRHKLINVVVVALLDAGASPSAHTPGPGQPQVKNVTPAHVRGLYREKLEAGLSPRTVQYVHVTLHKALKQAVPDGLIPRNATEAVRPPQVSKEEIRPLSR